ncbi:MAG: hypothetical protein ACQ9MH_03265 [Nitrospinales bacterium]
MASMKGILFNQHASEGLNKLVSEMQKTYTLKKGRRFNHSKITYEVSRPVLRDNMMEFEISSKIPEDEIKDSKQMQNYFQGIKKSIPIKDNNPVSVEMENIVWDSKKENEKERDYVKLLYRYPLDDLYSEEEVSKEYEKKDSNSSKKQTSDTPRAFTAQGNIVLACVEETIQDLGRKHIESLIKANDKIRSKIKN